MIIKKNGEIIESKDFQLYKFEHERHYVKGLVYIPGFRAGKESIEQIHKKKKIDGNIPFDCIYGAYTYCIAEDDGSTVFFASNSEMHCLFTSKEAVSSVYLEQLSYRKKHDLKCTFNEKSICEYITLGKVFFYKTFVSEITMLPNTNYFLIKDNTIITQNKNINGIDGKSNIGSPETFFNNLSYALSNRKVCAALTGGYDSRLVDTMLSRNLPLKLFYSTNNPNSKEGKAAKAVAKKLNCPFTIYHTNRPDLTDASLKNLVSSKDGIGPIDLEGTFRINNLRKNLVDEGFDVYLTGDGGVLHKDWEWMQDLPFYNKKATNLKKFYHQRIAMHLQASDIGSKLHDSFNNQEAYFIKKLELFKKETNTKSYDSLYHYVSGSQCIGYNYDPAGFSSYAPLWELDLVRYSYHLPRRKRFFYNSMREMTTKANPEVAKIPTNYGTTASSEKRYILRDIFFQLKGYGVKAIRLFNRTVFHKTFTLTSEKLIDWSLEADLRAMEISKKAILWAQENEILNNKYNNDTIPYDVLTRILHLYILKSEYLISLT